jgi:hypothetical protein
MVSEPGSFAEQTIVRRKPQLIADLLRDNAYPPQVVTALRALEREIATAPVAPLTEDAPDVPAWRAAWQPWQGRGWRELPWFFAETYFYRRVLEVVRYFQPGPWQGVDPFAVPKRAALAEGLQTLAAFVASVPPEATLAELFALWLQRSLWGNRADLSNAAVTASAHRLGLEEPERLLVDHTAAAWKLFRTGRVRRLILATDNSGLELLSDLGWLDLLLRHHLVGVVQLQVKPQPYFVSDAMPADVADTLAALSGSASPAFSALGQRLHAARAAGQLVVATHPFWASSQSFWQLPDDLRATLATADLFVCKGDVNYRRLLDDRHWPPTTDLATLTTRIPTALLALRTMKGELVAGLAPGQAERCQHQDPQWMLNGVRGLIHLVARERNGAA